MMARLLMAVTIVFHLLVPLALAGWLFWTMPESRLHLLSKIVLVGSFVGLLWTGGSGWHVAGTVFRPIVAGVTVLAILGSLLMWPDLDWWSGPPFPTGALVVLWFVLGGVFAAGWANMAAGARPPADVETVDLAFPLTDGDYYVVWGGSTEGMNRHMKILEVNPDYRGQAYALDLVEVSGPGTRAGGLQPSDPAAYDIYGERLVAPCAGQVIRAVDDRPDMNPPTRGDGHPAGNHVLLRCDGYEVLLAHLKQGSLEVAEGKSVAVGDPIGLVGNSGNTTEPHLHIHAQRPADEGPWMSGDPLAVTFDGAFYAKGETVSR